MPTVLIPGSLLPAEIAAEAAQHLPAHFSTLVRRAHQRDERLVTAANEGAAHWDWLAREVFGSDAAAPTAPYALAALTGRRTEHMVWQADPIHIEASRDGLYAQPLPLPADEDAEPLIAVANDALDASGCRLERHSSTWFFYAPYDWQFATVPLAGRVRPLEAATDQGTMAWARLHNAIQMSWYEHPVNQRRESAGELSIGGVWLHGGGRWQPLPATRFAQVDDDDPALRGALAAAVGRGGESLLIRNAASVARQQDDWAGWLSAMTAIDQRLQHLTGELTLVLTGVRGVRTLHVRPFDVIKPWQHAPVAQRIAEPA